jgi:hypothetical protein
MNNKKKSSHPEISLNEIIQMGPISKWKYYRIFPYKLLVFFILILLCFTQILFPCYTVASTAASFYELFDSIFLPNDYSRDSNIDYSYHFYTIDDFINHLNKTMCQFYTVFNFSLSSFFLPENGIEAEYEYYTNDPVEGGSLPTSNKLSSEYYYLNIDNYMGPFSLNDGDYSCQPKNLKVRPLKNDEKEFQTAAIRRMKFYTISFTFFSSLFDSGDIGSIVSPFNPSSNSYNFTERQKQFKFRQTLREEKNANSSEHFVSIIGNQQWFVTLKYSFQYRGYIKVIPTYKRRNNIDSTIPWLAKKRLKQQQIDFPTNTLKNPENTKIPSYTSKEYVYFVVNIVINCLVLCFVFWFMILHFRFIIIKFLMIYFFIT